MKQETIRLRPVTPDDGAELLAVYAPYVEKTAVTFEYEVPSLGEFRERIARTLEKYPWIAAERGGELLGYAYAGCFHARPAYDWAVETSLYVREDVRRAGVGRILHQGLEKALFQQNILNMNACIAFPRGEDPFLTRDSVLFHRRMGYRMVGRFSRCGCKFDRWYDMVWMEKLIGEHPIPPPPVIPFPGIREGLEL